METRGGERNECVLGWAWACHSPHLQHTYTITKDKDPAGESKLGLSTANLDTQGEKHWLVVITQIWKTRGVCQFTLK